MKYNEIETNGYLSNFVKCFWTFETNSQSIEHTILPNCYFDLIVAVKNKEISTVKLTGIWTVPVKVKIDSNTQLFAVRFKPLATQILENINLKTLLNSLIILKNDFIGLDKISFDDFTVFCSKIISLLENKIKQNKPVCNRKISLFQNIFQKTTFSVQELSSKSNMTSRQINRFFNSDYGLSLKTYLDIVRCYATLKPIAKNETFNQFDYYDQSHFIKETKKYTGVTPKELRKNKNDRFLQLLTIK